MTTYYKATFSDGTVVKRSTASRVYTHAWLVRWRCSDEYIKRGFGETSESSGFSGNERLAQNETIRRASWNDDRVLLAEVRPAIEITRKEYKS